jgi:hypothetical protein
MKNLLKTLTVIILSTSVAFSQRNANTLSLTASSSINSITDQTIIRLDSNATLGFDFQYDAYKLMNGYYSPSLGSTMSNIDYSINTLPAKFSKIIVPLKLAGPKAANYTITAAQLHPFDSTISITFVDSLTHTHQDLKKQTTYNFTLTGRDTLTNRFYIVLIKEVPTNINTTVKSHTTTSALTNTTTNSNTNSYSLTTSVTPVSIEKEGPISIFAYNNVVTVVNKNTSGINASIAIYSLQGNVIFEVSSLYMDSNTEYKINLADITSNVYIVSLSSSEISVAQRVVIEN